MAKNGKDRARQSDFGKGAEQISGLNPEDASITEAEQKIYDAGMSVP